MGESLLTFLVWTLYIDLQDIYLKQKRLDKKDIALKKGQKMQISTLFRKNLPAVSRIRLSHMQQNPTLLRKILAPANAKFDQFKSLFAFFKLILFLEPRSFGRCWGMPWSIWIWNKIDFARHVEFRPYWENGSQVQSRAIPKTFTMICLVER